MKLNIMERMHLLGPELMPNEGDRLLCGLIRTARAKLDINPAEAKAINYRIVGLDRFAYDIPKAEAIEIEVFLPSAVIAAIWLRLQQLDRTHKLRPEWLDLYDKFQAEASAEEKEAGFA
jgi:hypothetical protein